MTLKKIAEWDLTEQQTTARFDGGTWNAERGQPSQGFNLVCSSRDQANDISLVLTEAKVFPAIILDDHPVELIPREVEDTKNLIDWLWEYYKRYANLSEPGVTQEDVDQFKRVMESLNKG